MQVRLMLTEPFYQMPRPQLEQLKRRLASSAQGRVHSAEQVQIARERLEHSKRLLEMLKASSGLR
jgi:hypothetical protein